MVKKKRGLKVCSKLGGRWSFQKILFLVVVILVSLGVVEVVDATTYYVDCDIGSSGDGSSWAQAFKTIGEGENAATQSGDMVEISDCTYSESVTAAYAGVTFKGSTEAGHNDEVIIDTTYNGFYTTKDNITLQDVTVIGGATYGGAVRSTGDNFIANNITVRDFVGYGFYFYDEANNFLVKNSHAYGDNYVYVKENSTGAFQYSIFRGKGVDDANQLLYANHIETKINISNCLFIGSYRWIIYVTNNALVTIRNSFIGGNGREQTFITDTYSIYAATGGTVDVDYSIVNGHGLDPHNVNMNSDVTVGSNVTQNAFPYFNGWTVNEGIFTITVDDKVNLDNANNLSQVLDNYGLNLTYFLDHTHLVTSSQWDTIKDMQSRGHDIGSHTRHHPHLTKNESISITYSGSDTNVNATISDNATKFQINTTEGNDNIGPLNLTSTSYDTLDEFCDYLNSLNKFSCSLLDSWFSNVLSTSLADNYTNLTDNSAHNISYDMRMPSAGGRYFIEELNNSKSDIETGIGSGYVVKSLGYPGHDHDSTVRAAVKEAGYEVARGSVLYGTADHLLQNIENIYQAPITITTTYIKGSNYDTLTDTEKETRIRSFARAYATFALENGVWASITIHGADGFNTTELGWLVDELVDNGVTIMSMREAIEYIKANWTTSDNVTFTRTYSDSSNYTLQSTSSLIDAGINVSLTRDYNNVSVPQGSAPDIGAYEYYLNDVVSSDFDGSTTALNTVNLSNITNLVIEKTSYGKINFSESVNLSGGADINTHVNISNNRISINSTALSELNKSATLTLYNLTFTNPRVLRDGSVCPLTICTTVSYSGGTLVFNVTSFSAYSTEETPTASEETRPSEARGGYATFKPSQEQLKKGYEKSLRKNWKIQFEFNDETHTVKLDNIVNKTAIITISSVPVTFNLTVNETKKLDLDNDNYYDLEVFLKDISDYRADLVLKFIHEEIPKCEPNWECTEWSGCVSNIQTRICTDLNDCNVTEGKLEEIRRCEAKAKWWLWLALGIAVVIIAIILIVRHKKITKLILPDKKR